MYLLMTHSSIITEIVQINVMERTECSKYDKVKENN